MSWSALKITASDFSFSLVTLGWVFQGLLTTIVLSQEPANAPWESLFNERDLAGWVLVNTPDSTWSVQDKQLICTGKPIGEIRTDRMFQNFVLELEWRHMVPKGNAGVFVWADDITARGVPFHRSIEVQVLENAYGSSESHTTHGDIFPIHGAVMTPINGRGKGSRAFPTQELSKPSPEWNHYRIHCQDGKISLSVNGVMVTQGKDASPRKGYICLESEGGVVHYRNIRIQVLPDSPIEAKDVAVFNRGYRSLYSGLHFDGWVISPSAKNAWTVNDWILKHPMASSDDTSIRTERHWKECGFVCDFRLASPNSTFTLQVPTDKQMISSANVSIAAHLEKTGAWNRIEGSIRDGKLNVSINGKSAISDEAISSVPGPLVLVPKGPVDMANIYVRD